MTAMFRGVAVVATGIGTTNISKLTDVREFGQKIYLIDRRHQSTKHELDLK